MTIIDISRWQGDIDWPRLRNEGGVTYAIMRCTLGSTGVDDRYAEYWRESQLAGIERRAEYHYVITGTSAIGQRDNILRTTKGDFGNEKLVIDCERTAKERKAVQAGWKFPSIEYTAMVRSLCYSLKPHVQQGIRLYSNKYEWEALTLGADIEWAKEFGLHIAGYPNDPNNMTYRPLVPKPWTTWEMWQYSDKGRLPGIAGNVDLNRENVTLSPIPPLDPIAAQVLTLARVARERAQAILDALEGG